MKETTIIEVQDLMKTYVIGETITHALNGVSLQVQSGEFVAITGKSGSGKSTLLYQMSLLDRPTSGTVLIKGDETGIWKGNLRIDTRLTVFGYVFQDYALVPELTALENVMLPYYMSEGYSQEYQKRGLEMLELVGLGDKGSNRPGQLSGGEQQRVSIARALVNEPEVLFADEPTANLDSETSKVVMDIFQQLHSKGLTIVMVTHEPEYAAMAHRQIVLKDGKIIP